MDEKRLKQIQTYNDKEHESVGHSTGIGLANVTRRLKLYYKTDHLISIESELGEGTRVKLVLPKKQPSRSEERRVGKEGTTPSAPQHQERKQAADTAAHDREQRRVAAEANTYQ